MNALPAAEHLESLETGRRRDEIIFGVYHQAVRWETGRGWWGTVLPMVGRALFYLSRIDVLKA